MRPSPRFNVVNLAPRIKLVRTYQRMGRFMQHKARGGFILCDSAMPTDASGLVFHEVWVVDAEIVESNGARIRVLVEAIRGNSIFVGKRLKIHVFQGRPVTDDEAPLFVRMTAREVAVFMQVSICDTAPLAGHKLLQTRSDNPIGYGGQRVSVSHGHPSSVMSRT